MEMKITGLLFGTINETKELLIVDLSKQMLAINNSGSDNNITMVNIDEKVTVFETDSMDFEILSGSQKEIS